MNTDEAIARLSTALQVLNTDPSNKEKLRQLTQGLLDDKHQHYFEQGLASNDKGHIIHGILGALSHYEAEKEKAHLEKNFASLTDHHH